MSRVSIAAVPLVLATLAMFGARRVSAQGGHVHGGHPATAGARGDSASMVAATERVTGVHGGAITTRSRCRTCA